jgi:DNA-directed RNA polymerase specialized sigma24 family protein
MHPPLSRADLATLIDEADAAARRLHRRLVLPSAKLDDLSQDLLVDLICRLPGFDARRGPIGAFAGMVLRNQSSRIASRVHRHRRAQGGALLSLDAFAGSSGMPISMMLADTDGLAA